MIQGSLLKIFGQLPNIRPPGFKIWPRHLLQLLVCRVLQLAKEPIVLHSFVFGIRVDSQFVLSRGRIDEELKDFAALVRIDIQQGCRIILLQNHNQRLSHSVRV